LKFNLTPYPIPLLSLPNAYNTTSHVRNIRRITTRKAYKNSLFVEQFMEHETHARNAEENAKAALQNP